MLPLVLVVPAWADATTDSGYSEEATLITGEGAGALLLGEPQKDLYGPGLTGALAVYRSMRPHLLFGLRLRGGMFFDAGAPDPSRADPATGGLGSLTLAARVRPLGRPEQASRAVGPWIEIALGGAATGDLLRPTAEAGLGWGFRAGSVVLGPTLRYLHVLQDGTGPDGGDANVVLAGIEVTLGDPRTLPPRPAAAAPAPPPPAPVEDKDGDGIPDGEDRCPDEPEDKDGFEDQDGCPDPDNDRDGIPDVADKCPNEAEVVNGVEDQDGCPDQGEIALVDDRVVLEERLLFETDRSRVSSTGRRILQAVVTLWKQHPEWERMEVEGHADQRGSDAYNQRLSEQRAKRVATVLVELGIDPEKLFYRGFGRTRPRAPGNSPEELQQNRRVELVVIRKLPAEGAVPGEAPALPPAPPAGGPGASSGAAPAAPPAAPPAGAPAAPPAAPLATPPAAPPASRPPASH